jgi:hypothetical protein
VSEASSLSGADQETLGLTKRERLEFLGKLEKRERPDFTLDVAHAKPAEYFAERFAAAVPKVDKKPE